MARMALCGADKPELKKQGQSGVGWLRSPEVHKVVDSLQDATLCAEV